MREFSLILINFFSIVIVYQLFRNSSNTQIYRKFSAELSSYKPYVTFRNKIEARYLIQTQLNRYFSMDTFIGIYTLWAAIACAATILVQINFLLKLLLLIFSVSIPVLLIEKYLNWVDIKIDQGIFELLTQVNSRLIKNEDILIALRDAQTGIKNKYVLHIIESINQMIKVGIPPTQVFKTIQASVHNDYMKYVLINIEVVLTRRGNIPALMKALESEFTSIQIEVNKRKVELEYEKNMMAFSVLLVTLTVIKIVDDHDYILVYFQKNESMVYLILVFVLFGLTFALSTSRRSY